jgi:uncharacterized protein YlxW (UPF0749 family)
MFIQFKTVDETNITQIENMQESELTEKLATWKEKYEETQTKLEETKAKLQEYRQKRADNLETTELLEQELLQAKMIAGLTDVKGDGVVVTYYDDSIADPIEASNLIELVNELKLAGAEAISINDQRIINMSNIVNIDVDGTEFILVDTVRVTSPYIIKAIGDQTYLESALTIKTIGFVTRNENATVEKQKNITIYKYNGEIKLNYAKDVVKEED